MIFGVAPAGSATPRVSAIVTRNDLAFAASLLIGLAEKVKGKRLTYQEKRQVTALAPEVALRRKQDLRPVLTQTQALRIWQIVAGS